MAYNNLIGRTDAAALIPEEVSREIIQAVPQRSAVMRLARRLPNMSRKQYRMPVMSALVSAYFVDPSDTGAMQTSEVNWSNVYINAEKLAVIVPIPKDVLEDQDYDLWGEVRPQIDEAFGKAFDAAVLFGTSAPTSWPTAIVTAAASASHNIDGTPASGDIFDAIMGTSGLIACVEEDGYAVNGYIGALSLRARLRGLRLPDGAGNAGKGEPLFRFEMGPQNATQYSLDGNPVLFPTNGAMDANTAWLIGGDWNQLVYSMRSDISYEILTQSVIQDGSGAIVFNLAQQDMVALKATMRLGWQTPNPINRVNTNSATRYPFAYLTP